VCVEIGDVEMVLVEPSPQFQWNRFKPVDDVPEFELSLEEALKVDGIPVDNGTGGDIVKITIGGLHIT
jgi:hypothetical protein